MGHLVGDQVERTGGHTYIFGAFGFDNHTEKSGELTRTEKTLKKIARKTGSEEGKKKALDGRAQNIPVVGERDREQGGMWRLCV